MLIEVVDDWVNRFPPCEVVHQKTNRLPEGYLSIDRGT